LNTEQIDPRFAELDRWPTEVAITAMLDGQAQAIAAVQAAAAQLARAAEAAALRLQAARGRLVYVGAGTSGRVAVQDGVELGPTFDFGADRVRYVMAGGDRALVHSVEGAEDDAEAGAAAMRALGLNADDVVIGVAASGNTPYTVAAIRAARGLGALTIGIASNAGTQLLAAAAHPIHLQTGAEPVAGSTRMQAGTAQKAALNMLSTAIMLRLGRVYRGLMVNMRVSNRKLRARAIGMVAQLANVADADAERALDRAEGDIKVAVLVCRGIDIDAARAALVATHDNLRAALERLAPAQG
jgi:N-acetylmuramic acid 6-phosphate etherase